MDAQKLTGAFELYLRGAMLLNDQVRVAPATSAEDWEAVRQLRQSYGGMALTSHGLDEGDFKGVVYIAEADGMAVGTVRVINSRDTVLPDLILHPWRTDLLSPNADYIEVGRLVVHPRYRTFMVSAALFRAVMVYTVERGAQGLLVTCLDILVNYYARMGFRWVERDASNPHGPCNFMLLDDVESPIFTAVTSLTRAMISVFGATFTVPVQRT